MSPSSQILPGIPDVESPLFEAIFTEKEVSPETMTMVRKVRRDGYAIIDFPDPLLITEAANIRETLDAEFDWYSWRTGKVQGMRLQDAWQRVPDVLRIASNAQLVTLLSQLYGRRAFPFQTLNFPVGTEEHPHSDAVHFNSNPERFMCAVLVALEDIDSENGPPVYYPRSHRLPILTNELIGVSPDTQGGDLLRHYPFYAQAWRAMIDAENLEPVEFSVKAGQAILFAGNLLHGGARHVDKKRSCWTQLTHYFFEECAYYTPLASLPFLGPMIFRPTIDISTGLPIPQTVNGTEIPQSHIAYTAIQNHSTRPTLTPPAFERAAYLKANPDVAASDYDAVAHWLTCGYREKRPLR